MVMHMNVMRSRSPWLFFKPAAFGAFASTKVEADVLTVASHSLKLKSIEDLPSVGTLEMLYRVIFQGYLSRLHELQVSYSGRFNQHYC